MCARCGIPTKEPMPVAEYFRLAYCIARGLPYRPPVAETAWHFVTTEAKP